MATITLVPKVVNLALYAGDGVPLRMTVQSSAGVPWDLSAGEVMAQIRASRSDANPLEAFAVDMTDAATGVAVLTLTGDQTSALVDAGEFTGAWDVQYTPAGEEPTTLLQGAVTCEQDVTRP